MCLLEILLNLSSLFPGPPLLLFKHSVKPEVLSLVAPQLTQLAAPNTVALGLHIRLPDGFAWGKRPTPHYLNWKKDFEKCAKVGTYFFHR